MEPAPHDEFAREVPPRPSGNGMGVAGFIISLVGLILTCGLLCPIGLIFSLIALGRKPRGLAIAGTILGAIGSLFLVGAFTVGRPVITTALRYAEAVETMNEYKRDHGDFPDEEEAIGLLTKPDGWGTPFRYRRTPGGYEIISASFDRKFDTQDDMRFPGK